MSPTAAVAIAAAAASIVASSRADRVARRVRGRLGASHRARRIPVPPWVRRAAAPLGWSTSVDDAIALWGGGLACLGALAWWWAPARLLAVALLVGPPLGLRTAGRRARQRRRRDLPAALDAVGSALRAGSSLSHALASTAAVGGPIADELTSLHLEHLRGRALTDVVEEWREQASDIETGIAGAALALAARLGGPGARALDGAARSIRERHSSEADLAAMAAQARLSALILTVAPAAFTVLLVSVDPQAAHFLTATAAGWGCLAGGLLLDALGAVWMQRLVRGRP